MVKLFDSCAKADMLDIFIKTSYFVLLPSMRYLLVKQGMIDFVFKNISVILRL